jgi:phosphoribosylanthranilate isomerase
MIKIKICGLTDIEAAKAAVESGADFLGMVLAPSRRQLSLKDAKKLADGIHQLKQPPPLIGVFANALASEVNTAASLCNLDLVQLSGDESWRYCRQIEYPIVKVIHIKDDTEPKHVLNEMAMGLQTPLKTTPLFLLDSSGGNYGGGSGITFDWQLATTVATQFPVIIAGGLNSSNVTELINKVRPWGVDVKRGINCYPMKEVTSVNMAAALYQKRFYQP